MMKQASSKAHGTKKFIINFFGESGAGKTTVLCRLIEMLRRRSRYNLEVADGFRTHDRRAMMWCQSGMLFSGAVCVCTLGDTPQVVQANIDFFKRFFDMTKNKMPWNAWCDAIRGNNPRLKSKEIKSTKKTGRLLGVLVTASRKPLQCYKLKLPSDSILLNVPIRIDACNDLGHLPNGFDWTSSVLVPAEVLLFHVNYILRNGCFRSYTAIQRHRVSITTIRSSVSMDK